MSERKYSFRTVWSDEDHEWVAFSPEFDGVSGLGKDPETALREARAALDLAIETYQEEGWALPEPQQLPDHSGQFRLRLPRSLHARLAQLAADEGVSQNALAASLIAEGLGGVATVGIAARRLDVCFAAFRSEFISVIQPQLVSGIETVDTWSGDVELGFSMASQNAVGSRGAAPWQS